MSHTKRKTVFSLLIIGVVFLYLVPYIWFGLASFKSQRTLTAIPPVIFPKELTLYSYHVAFQQKDLLLYLKNSAIVATLATLGSITLGVLAAYPLSRVKIHGKNLFLLLFLAVSMFPQMALVGPIWRIMRELGWLNTYQGLIFPYITLTLPLAVWILVRFFEELPREIEEAALVDGCTPLKALWKVILPLAAPGVFTAAILVFIYTWNEFFFALLIMTYPARHTLPVGIALFPGEYTMPWGEIAAASVVATIPLICLVLFCERYIISGLTAGAVKG